MKSTFKEALRDGLPIGLGYFAVSFAFGIMAVGMGLSITEAVLISMLNMTSAGQLAALPIITGGGSLIELALTQAVINSRYSLMSVSMSQRFGKDIKIRHRFIHAFNLTDEMFAVAISKSGELHRGFLTSLLILPYLGWTLGTLIGAVAGNILPAIVITALSVAMYAMFIAIFVPAMRQSLPVSLLVAASIALSALFYYLPALSQIPDGFVIISVAVVCSLLFALLAPIKDGENEDSESRHSESRLSENEPGESRLGESARTASSDSQDAYLTDTAGNEGVS